MKRLIITHSMLGRSFIIIFEVKNAIFGIRIIMAFPLLIGIFAH